MWRSGTTTLDQSLGADRCLLVNCDLPATEDMLRDPVLLFRDGERPVVVFDESHQLSDPSRVLKVAADELPKLRVLATGSSTLEAMQAHWPDESVRYWRDKAGREVDFVRPRARDAVDAYECKWDAGAFDPTALKVFRKAYPKGDNYLLSPLTGRAYVKKVAGMEITVRGLEGLE